MRDPLSAYLDDVNRHPLLPAEEENRLGRLVRDSGDLRAAHRLVEANLRFVVKVAKTYRRQGLALPDLIQEGNLGLMKAVTKFDPDRGLRLITYAAWWIRAYIQAHVMRSWSLVRVGTTQTQRRLFFSLARLRAELALDGLEGTALDEQVARRLHIGVEEVREMAQRIDARDQSFDAPAPNGGPSPLDRVASAAERPDELVFRAREQAQAGADVSRALAQLDVRERAVAEERLMADDPPSLREMGERLGFSRERARQIEVRTRRKLRAALGPLALAG